MFRHVLNAVALAVFAGGCVAPPPPRVEQALLDGFEDCEPWCVDSADNHGAVRLTDRNVTEGAAAMAATFFDNGRGKTTFRREVRYDLSRASRLWLDVFNHEAAPDTACSLAFYSESLGFFETAPVKLAPGINRNLSWSLNPAAMRRGTDRAAWQAARGSVDRMMILVYPGSLDQGRLTFDNLRADRGGIDLAPRLKIAAVEAGPDEARCYEVLEIRVSGELPADAADVRFETRLLRPDGYRMRADGFLLSSDSEAGTAVYATRFTPDVPGRWDADIGYLSGGQWFSLRLVRFRVAPAIDDRGWVQVDPEDQLQFRLSSGRRFYPIGQNLAWAGDYKPYLDAVRACGGNAIRVWICPWNYPLLSDGGRKFDPASAAAIDRLMNDAAARGIYVQLVMSYHGWLGADWNRNVFNSAMGGPCALPQDFWVSGEARARFRAYLGMAVARWAVFPNLLAWELMNEAHLTPRYDDEDIIRWHSEMARAIKEADLYHHLVTASVDDSLARIWRDPAIDFTTAHLYGPDLTSLVNRDRVRGLRYPKPFWIQEIGRSVSAGGENADPLGRHLHHALWLSWMTPAAGCAMPWWWDTQIQRLHLYPHFAALSAFDRGEERRGGGFRCWTLAVTGEGNAAVSVQLLAGRTAAYGFVYSPETVRDPSLAPRDPLIAGGRRLALEGLMDGAYELEFWDTYSGVVADRRKASCEGGRILIDLPPGRADFAFKLKAVSRRELGARME